MIYLLIFGVFYFISLFIFGIPNYKKLDRLTRSKGDRWCIQTKYNLLFLYFGYICFLFLDRIKHNRKIYFYEMELKYLNGFYNKNNFMKEKIKNISLILKIEYLKRKNKKNFIYTIKNKIKCQI